MPGTHGGARHNAGRRPRSPEAEVTDEDHPHKRRATTTMVLSELLLTLMGY